MNPFGVTDAKAEALAERMSTCGIADADLEESFVRSGGAGGQHVNKSATCVFLRHIPSNTQVKMQQARSQGLNRYYARKRLCELLEAAESGVTLESERAEKIRKQKARRRRRTRSSPGANETPPAAQRDPGADSNE